MFSKIKAYAQAKNNFKNFFSVTDNLNNLKNNKSSGTLRPQ